MLKLENKEDGIELTMDASELLVSKLFMIVALPDEAILVAMKFFLKLFILLKSIEPTKSTNLDAAVLLKMAKGIALAIATTSDKDWFDGILAPSELARAGGICLELVLKDWAIKTESDCENEPICPGVNMDTVFKFEVKYEADGDAIRLASAGNCLLHNCPTLDGKKAIALRAKSVVFILKIVLAFDNKRLKLQSGLQTERAPNLKVSN